jgi:hypothetical protein|tara:strand:- start:188 stop:352 length:165 start_codon:yes stop_codon:yes gene_type:complete
MSCSIKHTVKGAFDKVVEWDKKFIDVVEKKLNLSQYQSKCLSFASGFVIGAILL